MQVWLVVSAELRLPCANVTRGRAPIEEGPRAELLLCTLDDGVAGLSAITT